ncbi:MAG: phosphoheptose isomerase [Alphaproteobacteria bacterium CG_4_10_14_0_2_um_filter_63_37]|nr:MAG: phosphoheptose isomerase [Alphaproteobacteria bacterium CG_4_10_14_0_2_um_filter_63_37]
MLHIVQRRYEESIQAKSVALPAVQDDIIKAVDLLTDTLVHEGKILICGNGGSAADAQHFSGELLNRFQIERPPLPGIALTTDSSTLTAIGNDYSFDEIFSKQVEALGRRGDVLFGISTSGNSGNVLRAIERGRELGMKIIGLLGRDGGKIAPLCDVAIVVPSNSTPRVQENHILIVHILCELIDERLFGRS